MKERPENHNAPKINTIYSIFIPYSQVPSPPPPPPPKKKKKKKKLAIFMIYLKLFLIEFKKM